VDLAPEIGKLIGKMLVSHFKPSALPKQWEVMDISILFDALPDEAKALIAQLRGYDNGLLHSGCKGVAPSTLAEILGWSPAKVNGMMSPISRTAANMGKAPVIIRSGQMLRLSEDFHKAYLDYIELPELDLQ